MNPTCKLCKKEKDLKQSHIIPKFIGKWLRDSSGTGFIRGLETPNLRVQDIKTDSILCAECEQIFSKWEGKFADNIFHPLNNDRYPDYSILYDDWLLKFITSLSWRVALDGYETFIQENPEWKDSLSNAMEQWRLFLLDEIITQYPLTHHMYFYLPIVSTFFEDEYQDAFVYYIRRHIESVIASSQTELCVYTQIPNIMMISFIDPPNRDDWIGTQIYLGTNYTVTPQLIYEPGHMDFISSRLDLIIDAKECVSPRQLDRMINSMRRNPSRFFRSKTYEAHRESERL